MLSSYDTQGNTFIDTEPTDDKSWIAYGLSKPYKQAVL